MELINIFVSLFLFFLKPINTYCLATISVLLLIILKIYYPKIRGFMGEFWVKKELSKLNKEEYIILNDIMLEQNNNMHQIDHLVISKYGVFVIEMKNYYGMILGDEYKDTWTQYLGKNKYHFKNPIHQNYGHVKAIEELLKIENEKLISIVCFSNQAKLKIKTMNPVVNLNNLISLIKKFNIIIIDNNITEIEEKINSANIICKNRRKQHVKNIKTKIKKNYEKSDNMICPKCGNQLVHRNGRYGSFIGCSNYPKCKYIK